MTYPLADLLKDSAYKLTQFSAEKIKALESAITVKEAGKKPAPYVTCLVRGNVFKPHTGTKTSVLFVQKWNDDAKTGPLCPRLDDYPIFFATMREPSKDNSGDKIFVKLKDGEAWDPNAPSTNEIKVSEPVDHYDVAPQTLNDFVLDEHEHLVVKHDLFSHTLKDGKRTPDGIAEAFIEFAKNEGLGFWRGKP
ncbi:hypothetical protein [Thiobacillus sp.]|uniref:hypothetical protein n=1 Tax=Thiobacillus sp. TaxID=924 RepID=UPI0025D8A38E|nr:hypothetical protein [Thiobacillus sp.]